MPRRNLQERVARMRKKIHEQSGNTVVINDGEAFEALKQLGDVPNTVNHVVVTTGACCGLAHDEDGDILYPCGESVKPEFGCAFCSLEHQRSFESNLPSSVVRTFYALIGTVNIYRPDILKRFHIEWLTCAYVIISRKLQKPLVINVEDDNLTKAFQVALCDPFELGRRFRDEFQPDAKKFRSHRVITEHVTYALNNAVLVENFDTSNLEETPVFLISPCVSQTSTPRSANQSPRDSPRSTKQSPRQPSGLQESSS